jgi:hypothetical protein
MTLDFYRRKFIALLIEPCNASTFSLMWYYRNEWKCFLQDLIDDNQLSARDKYNLLAKTENGYLFGILLAQYCDNVSVSRFLNFISLLQNHGVTGNELMVLFQQGNMQLNLAQQIILNGEQTVICQLFGIFASLLAKGVSHQSIFNILINLTDSGSMPVWALLAQKNSLYPYLSLLNRLRIAGIDLVSLMQFIPVNEVNGKTFASVIAKCSDKSMIEEYALLLAALHHENLIDKSKILADYRENYHSIVTEVSADFHPRVLQTLIDKQLLRLMEEDNNKLRNEKEKLLLRLSKLQRENNMIAKMLEKALELTEFIECLPGPALTLLSTPILEDYKAPENISQANKKFQLTKLDTIKQDENADYVIEISGNYLREFLSAIAEFEQYDNIDSNLPCQRAKKLINSSNQFGLFAQEKRVMNMQFTNEIQAMSSMQSVSCTSLDLQDKVPGITPRKSSIND